MCMIRILDFSTYVILCVYVYELRTVCVWVCVHVYINVCEYVCMCVYETHTELSVLSSDANGYDYMC